MAAIAQNNGIQVIYGFNPNDNNLLAALAENPYNQEDQRQCEHCHEKSEWDLCKGCAAVVCIGECGDYWEDENGDETWYCMTCWEDKGRERQYREEAAIVIQRAWRARPQN
jgi:hypothetical protein